jgi:hypothetical protein
MGIPDHESWLLREHDPTGRASRGRRTAMIAFLVVFLAIVVLSLIAAIRL